MVNEIMVWYPTQEYKKRVNMAERDAVALYKGILVLQQMFNLKVVCLQIFTSIYFFSSTLAN